MNQNSGRSGGVYSGARMGVEKFANAMETDARRNFYAS